jgi:RHS repeat-associated protein
MNLLAESELARPREKAILYEYIWFNDRPVAQVDAGVVTHWTFTDHLGTPLIQTTDSQAVWWRAEYEPYGRVFAYNPPGLADQHQPLRLPGQEAEQLNLGQNGATERSYNIFRWYRPAWGRYTQPDPLGRRGEANQFAYAQDNPVDFEDPLGLKSRVCCRTFGLLGFRHCYVESVADGRRTSCGLIGGIFSGEPWGTGRIYPDNGFDTGGTCGDWNDSCGADRCVVDTARSYANPSQYNFGFGPNSNTFASTIARACGLNRPPVGANTTPGWGQPPAPPKRGKPAEPVLCHAP